MTTVKQAIGEIDVGRAAYPVGRWPAGTMGTVVHDLGEWKQIEISGEDGVMLEHSA